MRSPEDFAARVDELAALEDGWLDGGGVAPDVRMLRALAGVVTIANERYGAPLPYAYPTEDGGVSLEWGDLDVDCIVSRSGGVFSWSGDGDCMNMVCTMSEAAVECEEWMSMTHEVLHEVPRS